MTANNDYAVSGDPFARFRQEAQFLGITNQAKISEYIQNRVTEEREDEKGIRELERQDRLLAENFECEVTEGTNAKCSTLSP